MKEDRIKDKIEEIENYLEDLEIILPVDFEEYMDNIEKRAACERFFEKIAEAIVDLGFLFVRFKEYSEDIKEDTQVFEILFKKEIISKELCNKLKDAKSMRNILAHEYGKVNDKLVFEAITEEIIDDTKEFIELIERGLR